MIHFRPIVTSRLNVQLRELTMRQALEVAAVPPQQDEAATTVLLRSCIQSSTGRVSDPAQWTVQECMLVRAHYLSAVADDGPNFSVGKGRFLDYLLADMDAVVDSADAGKACGDHWRAHQLTGAQAEIMERMCQSRNDWLVADMAARLHAEDDEDDRPPDAVADPNAYGEWLAKRRDVILGLSEGEFLDLFGAYQAGLAELRHLFDIGFDAAGHLALPINREDGGDTMLAPARFPARSCVSRLAILLGE